MDDRTNDAEPLQRVTDRRRVSHGSGTYRVAGNRALTAAARVGRGIVRPPKERDKRVMLPPIRGPHSP